MKYLAPITTTTEHAEGRTVYNKNMNEETWTEYNKYGDQTHLKTPNGIVWSCEHKYNEMGKQIWAKSSRVMNGGQNMTKTETKHVTLQKVQPQIPTQNCCINTTKGTMNSITKTQQGLKNGRNTIKTIKKSVIEILKVLCGQ